MAEFHVEALVVGTVDLGVHAGATPDAAEVAAMTSPAAQGVEALLCPCCAAKLRDLAIEHVMSAPAQGAEAVR